MRYWLQKRHGRDGVFDHAEGECVGDESKKQLHRGTVRKLGCCYVLCLSGC